MARFFEELLNTLQAAPPAATRDYEQNMYFLLEQAKDQFLRLFDIPPRSPREKAEIDSGKARIGNRSLVFNEQFRQELFFLAQELDCSEFFCADLLHDVTTVDSVLGRSATAEKAVIRFHDERRAQLAVLRHVLEVAASPQPNPTRMEIMLQNYALELTATSYDLGAGKGNGKLADKILLEIDNLKLTIQKQRAGLSNAPSQTSTFAQPGTTVAKFNEAVINLRIECLEAERRQLGHILYILAAARKMDPSTITRMLNWLEVAQRSETLIVYILTATLAAIDPTPDLEDEDTINAEGSIITPPLASQLTTALSMRLAQPWRIQGLKSVVRLQSSLLLLEVRRHDPHMHGDRGIIEDEVTKTTATAIQEDALQYLVEILVNSRTHKSDVEDAVGGTLDVTPEPLNAGPETSNILIEQDFRPYLLEQVDSLVINIIITMPKVLRDARHREEDVPAAFGRSSRVSMSTPTADAARRSRNDIETFFKLVAMIYAEKEPDSALKFWDDTMEGNRLYGFLQWATEVKARPQMCLAYEMFASLARGASCASETFNFFISNGGQYQTSQTPSSLFSWPALFNSLTGLADSVTHTHPAHANTHGMTMGGMRGASAAQHPRMVDPGEVMLLQSFLRVLRNVVRYSLPARETIREHQTFDAIPRLFYLVSHHIPLELKAALYETLAAFCGSNGGLKGAETIKKMWINLEQAAVLPVRDDDHVSRRAAAMRSGAIAELEQIEAPAGRYPATVAFVGLLDALILTPSKRLSFDQGAEYETQTIPENLGAPHRSLGIGPYVSFVVDDLILKLSEKQFISQAEKFKLLDGCIQFVEKCLATYDLAVLRSGDVSQIAQPQSPTDPLPPVLISLLTHPGFDILTRLLSNNSPLRRELFTIVSQGYEAIERNVAKTQYLGQAVRRVLRIMYKVLQLQDLFIHTLLPILGNYSNLRVPQGILPLDQFLLWSPNLVPEIGLYVSRSEDEEMMLLAVNILSLLSDSPLFNVVDSTLQNGYRKMNRLVVLLHRHEHTPRIAAGFLRLLALDAQSDSNPAAASPEVLGVEDLSDESGLSQDLSHALRSSVMSLLLRNTQRGRPSPNIAHLLLGLPIGVPPSEMVIPDPGDSGASTSCLHMVLDLLNAGVPRLKASDTTAMDTEVPGVQPLFIRNPPLAEKCYRLVYNLIVHDYTSTSISRYLRTREDFFARHLAILPIKAPIVDVPNASHILYVDQTRLPTTCETLTAFLRLRSWLLEIVALELHALSDTKQHQRISRLLNLLFNAEESLPGFDRADAKGRIEDAFFGNATAGQPLIRILDIFDSLEFEWQEGIVTQPMNRRFFVNTDFGGCLAYDEEKGCQTYQVDGVLSLLTNYRRQLLRQGVVGTESLLKEMKEEFVFILKSCTVENHRLELEAALNASFEAWRQVLDVSLHKCFDRLPADRRETISLDILQGLPSFIANSSISTSTAVLLSETVLSLMTKLREDRHHQLILQSTVDDAYAASLPVDRLHSILRSIIQSIVQSGTAERVRGNLYAALINHLHLVFAPEDRKDNAPSKAPLERSVALSRSTSLVAEDSVGDGLFSSSINGGSRQASYSPKTSALETGTLSIVNLFVDRLVPIVCKDAADGNEVWRTIAFTLLDALVQLSRVEKAHRVLNVMAREGFLKNFVHGIKSSEADLSMVLKPDPENLNALYVHEAKMTLLIRVAQTRQGAERLLDCRLFSLLAQCDFLGARPQNDQAFLDFDSFLPSAIERYHQLIVPVLQLAVSVLSAVGSSPVVSKQALDFVLSHRATILLLLTDIMNHLSLAMLRELQLVVALCSFVLPSVDDLFSPTSFGPIHVAILQLSAKSINQRRWVASVIPVTEVEKEESEVQAPGYGKDGSIWADKVTQVISALRKWVTVYSMIVTEAPGDFKPVIAPVTTFTLEGELASHVTNPAPTITDIVVALKTQVNRFSTVLQQAQDISSKLANPSSMDLDEIDTIAASSGTEYLKELDIPQRRVMALGELTKAWERSRQDALDQLHGIEMLLLLIWRHLNFFLNTYNTIPQSFRPAALGTPTTDTGRSMKLLNSRERQAGSPGVDVQALQSQSAEGVLPILEQLENVALPKDVIGPESGSRRSYIDLLGRRLRELLQSSINNDQARS